MVFAFVFVVVFDAHVELRILTFWGESMIQLPEWSGGSSRRKRIVAKENGASLDLIIVLVGLLFLQIGKVFVRSC